MIAYLVSEFMSCLKDLKKVVKTSDDEHTGCLKTAVIEKNIQKVRDFTKNYPKSTLRYMESELNISKTAIYIILIEKLGLRKITNCSTQVD